MFFFFPENYPAIVADSRTCLCGVRRLNVTNKENTFHEPNIFKKTLQVFLCTPWFAYEQMKRHLTHTSQLAPGQLAPGQQPGGTPVQTLMLLRCSDLHIMFKVLQVCSFSNPKHRYSTSMLVILFFFFLTADSFCPSQRTIRLCQKGRQQDKAAVCISDKHMVTYYVNIFRTR